MTMHPFLIRMFLGLILLTGIVGCTDRAIDKGNTSLRLGDYHAATLFFGAALARDPGSFAARLGMGKALLQQSSALGDTAAWGEGLIHLEAARTINPAHMPRGVLPEAWTRRGRVLRDLGDTLGALDALTRALDLDPANTQAINLAGSLYFQMGYGDKAEVLFKRAITADSSEAIGYYNLGAALWLRGEYEGAHSHWLEALRRAPEDKDILYWFALARKRMQDSTAVGTGTR